MKKLNSIQFQKLEIYLESLEEKLSGDLSPFFSIRMLEIESNSTPAKIIVNAYPKTKPENGRFIERSANEFNNYIIDFFSHIENTNEQMQFRIAYELLEILNSCIDYYHSLIWEYLPDENVFDQLYDYIGWGFTYLIITKEKGCCLLIHGGYYD